MCGRPATSLATVIQSTVMPFASGVRPKAGNSSIDASIASSGGGGRVLVADLRAEQVLAADAEHPARERVDGDVAALLVPDHDPDLCVLRGVAEEGLLEERVGARLRRLVHAVPKLPRHSPEREGAA